MPCPVFQIARSQQVRASFLKLYVISMITTASSPNTSFRSALQSIRPSEAHEIHSKDIHPEHAWRRFRSDAASLTRSAAENWLPCSREAFESISAPDGIGARHACDVDGVRSRQMHGAR